MAKARGWRVRLLDPKEHDRTSFSCGVAELDRYLREIAHQDVRRNIARAFVAQPLRSADIAGYYTLSAASFRRSSLPARAARKLPRYPVPASIIGRLAVDQRWQRQGLGEYLLIDALTRLYAVSEVMAVHAVIVDAKDDNAAEFYAQYGFAPLADQALRLFLPMATVRRLVERGD